MPGAGIVIDGEAHEQASARSPTPASKTRGRVHVSVGVAVGEIRFRRHESASDALSPVDEN